MVPKKVAIHSPGNPGKRRYRVDMLVDTWNGSPRHVCFRECKTLSGNLSIGLCRVISVIVCNRCDLNVAMPMANSPTPSLQRNYLYQFTDTRYQPKITIHNSGIYLFENYFLHSAPLFSYSFSNSRSAKSKTWLRAVALLQTWHLNAMRQRLNAMIMTYVYIYVNIIYVYIIYIYIYIDLYWSYTYIATHWNLECCPVFQNFDFWT